MRILRRSPRQPVTVALIAAIALATASARPADGATPLALAAPFSEHMVLQRDRPLRIWGTAAAGTSVEVRLGTQTTSAAADANGAWMATLPPTPAGGPYELRITSGNDTPIVLRDVLVGDVWLCSGQSNMQHPLKDSVGGAEAAAAVARLPTLRLLSVPKTPAAQPSTTLKAAAWTAANERAASDFSAVAIYFAQSLIENDPSIRDVPIGLIDSSFGGTRIEGWIPRELLDAKFRPDELHNSIFGIKPTHLYNGMIRPLVGTTLRGVLWYQGESNTRHAPTYPAMFEAMAGQWRSDFGDPTLPFLIAQLPNYPEPWEGTSFAWMRDAQARIATRVPHVSMAVTIDTPDGYDLHPRNKRLVGERLALLARRDVYGEPILASGPTLKDAMPQGTRMRLTFDTNGSPLVAKENTLSDFTLAGEDGIYRNATARLDGSDSVIVESADVLEPKTVRYAWSASPRASLYNQAGLPAAPFRTDAQPQTTIVEVQSMPLPPRRVVAENYQATLDGDGALSSLTVGGKQMLHTDAAGGLVLLDGWGTRRLFESVDLAPSSVQFRDTATSVTYTFTPDRIVVDIKNAGSKNAIPVRLQLSSLAKPLADKTGNTFGRDTSEITVTGQDASARAIGVIPDLRAEVAPGATRRIEIAIRNKARQND